MDQDIDPRREDQANEQASAVEVRADKPKEYFSLWLSHSGAAQQFDDPRAAGAAFFEADPSERPSVNHVHSNSARTMARTEIHGCHEDGEPRYFKSLPDSHAPDAEFRAGFMAAMEMSVSERLDKANLERGDTTLAGQLDARLKDDLEAFARREPEKAAVLWTERSDEPAPGRNLQEAVRAQEATANAQVATYQNALMDKPSVIATGDWVTTDQNVDLRPVAVATDRGVHTGYEAIPPDGTSGVNFSERTFANSNDALRHAWNFYEKGEAGLESAVKRARAMDAAVSEAADSRPSGLVVEHREQPEFPRPETAIYAGNEAQLILTLGRDTEASRDLAERLVQDPEFRKVVAEHVPDTEATLGTGRFVDGEGSAGFLPNDLLAVTVYDRDGGAEILAKLPDEGPLSEALARHLAESPVLKAHVEEEQLRADVTADPARAISVWMAQSNAQIDRLPSDRQEELRSELRGIAKEAAVAFGLDREQSDRDTSPRSTLYSTAITETTLMVAGSATELQQGSAGTLRAGLLLSARVAGIDPEKLQTRLETGAASARQEDSWVKADLAEIAKRHGYDLENPQGRNAAAERLDRFYASAAELIQSARSADVSRRDDPLVEALDKMAKLQTHQGSVAFRNETQARDFAEEMKERYGASVLKDIAAGRTEALAKDVPDASARQVLTAAVISAAKEHPSLGLNAQEVEAAERRMAADVGPKQREYPQAHDRTHAQDREF